MHTTKDILSFEEFCERGEWLGQQSFIAGWLERAKWPSLEVIDDELMTRTRSTSKFPEFNNVFTTRISREHLARDVGRCVERLAEDGVPTRWYLRGHAGNTTVAEQLTQLGFEDFERYSVMATKLRIDGRLAAISATGLGPRSEKLPQTTPKDKVFGLVSDEATLKQWTGTLANILGYSKALETDWLDMLLCGGLGTERPWRQYFCKQDGEIVGVLSAFWTEQLVSIEAIGVLRRFRGRNLGSRLLNCALEDAINAGYEVVTAFPADYQHDFFKKNLFKKFGSIDCIAIEPSEAPFNKMTFTENNPVNSRGNRSNWSFSKHN